MLNWFRNFYKKFFNQTSEPEKNYAMDQVTLIPPLRTIPQTQLKDHYRVGYDNETGSTTLTLHSEQTSMTLSIGPEEVMRLIRLLSASLDDEDIENLDN